MNRKGILLFTAFAFFAFSVISQSEDSYPGIEPFEIGSNAGPFIQKSKEEKIANEAKGKKKKRKKKEIPVLMMVNSSTVLYYYNLTIDSIKYGFAIEDSIIRYIDTIDPNFTICNMRINDKMNPDSVKVYENPGWGYYTPLVDGWNAFIGSYDDLDYIISFFFKRGWNKRVTEDSISE